MIDKKMVDLIMKKLMIITDAFYNEEHLKYEFAKALEKELKRAKLDYKIIPEYHYNNSHFDLAVIDSISQIQTIFEFKYKTTRDNCTIYHKFDYELKSHRAWALGWFDCWKDIERNEIFVQDLKLAKSAFFILMTNDSIYYNKRTKNNKIAEYKCFEDFSVENGLHNAGKRAIDPSVTSNSAGKERKKHKKRSNNEGDIITHNDYLFEYLNFGNQGFRYLLLEVS